MRTSDVKAALRRKYPAQEYALMFEVGDATGSRVTRHADAVVMNLWPSRGLLVEGFEIKVSRSDWRRELADPAKSMAVQRFCDKWWVITPEGIVQEHEMPALWGHMVVSDKGAVRIAKAAPTLTPDALNRSFVAAMLRRAAEADEAQVNALVESRLKRERDAMQSRIDSEVERRMRKYKTIDTNVEKLRELGIDIAHPYADFPEDVRLGRMLRANFHLQNLSVTAQNLAKASETLFKIGEALSFDEPSVKKN